MIIYDDEKLADCLCEDCPTFFKPTHSFPKAEGVFCAKGKIFNIENKKGCMCHHCPVYSDNNLHGSYFCIYGPVD